MYNVDALLNLFFIIGATTKTTTKPQYVDPVCKAISAIARLMECKKYAMCNGKVFKKLEKSKFTYVECTTVENFLMAVLKNVEIAELLTKVYGTVKEYLKNPSCGLVRQLKIDYNVIEVLPSGTLFHIARKEFVQHETFNASPRAFIHYTYKSDRVPYPRPFVQGRYIVYCRF